MGKDLRPSPCVYCTFSGSRHGGSHKTSLRRERALCLFRQRGKAGRVVHGDVRQHLAVEGDAGLHQAVHEAAVADAVRSEEHTSELQALMRISYAVFCLKKKHTNNT